VLVSLVWIVDICNCSSVEIVDEFHCLGDMWNGDVDAAVTTRIAVVGLNSGHPASYLAAEDVSLL